MSARTQLLGIKNAKAFHLARWQEVYADAEWHCWPGRIETNRFGHVVMMPPPGFSHTARQSGIFRELLTRLYDGRTLAEGAVLTSDGVKGAGVAWISESTVKRGLNGEVLTIAPEICVEVVPPKNTRQDMEAKCALHFEAGADEVWICDKSGALHFFIKDNAGVEAVGSLLCLSMPAMIRS